MVESLGFIAYMGNCEKPHRMKDANNKNESVMELENREKTNKMNQTYYFYDKRDGKL